MSTFHPSGFPWRLDFEEREVQPCIVRYFLLSINFREQTKICRVVLPFAGTNYKTAYFPIQDTKWLPRNPGSLEATNTETMLKTQIVLAVALATLVCSQQTTVSGTTYSGCHAHGSTQYCYGPNGEETSLAVPITSAPATVSASATVVAQTTAITACHAHGSDTFCINGAGEEVQISIESTPTGAAPAQYTACHSHGSEQYCVDPEGNDVLVLEDEHGAEDAEDHSHELDDSAASEGQNCHFHAGVEYVLVPFILHLLTLSQTLRFCRRIGKCFI